MFKIQIPATSANLGAGFDALGLALSYYNYVEMEESDVLDISSADGLQVPTDEKNLIYISAKDLYNVCGKKLDGLKLIQTNNIPMARGLGSSSACIIAGLVGANKMLGNPLTKDDLVDLAAQIEGHPDNTAPALLGGIVTAVFDGKKVHWVKQEVFTKLKFVAIIPDFELKTDAARACLPKEVSHKDAVYNLSRAALFSASLLTGKFECFKAVVKARKGAKKLSSKIDIPQIEAYLQKHGGKAEVRGIYKRSMILRSLIKGKGIFKEIESEIV